VASYQAIAAVSRAIRGLLDLACPRPEFDGARFEVYQANNFQNPMDEGVSLYLYRVATSSRRNLPSRVGPNGETYRPPLPLDLYYMLTAWGRTFEKQQGLLGFCIRELGNVPILPSGLLNHFGPSDVFRPDETVELVFEPLSLQDFSNIWEPLKPNLQPSATYVARMVSLESTIQMPGAGNVQTRQFDFKNATTLSGK
jgi:Pvc16 N-terminal domain